MASYTSSSSSSSSSKTTTTTNPVPIPATNVQFWLKDSSGNKQFREPSPWLVCYLGADKLPGMVKVKVSGQERKIDVKDAPNQGNAKLTLKGYSPSTVNITITIWTENQWIAWQEMKPHFRVTDPKNKTQAIAIRNPVCEEAGISAIVIKKISGVNDGRIEGTKDIEIEGIEIAKVDTTAGGNAKGGGNADKEKYQHLVDSYVLMANTCAASKTGYPDWSSYCIGSGAPEYANKPFPGYMQYMPYTQSGGKVS